MKLERPDVNLQTEHRKFIDHWTAKTGRDATKLDWDATWRNWIRNAKPNQNNNTKPSRTDQGIAETQALKQLYTHEHEERA